MSYKADCPKCGGYTLYVTPHNGLSYCFRCNYYERDGKELQGNQHAYQKRVRERSQHLQDIRAYYTHMAQYYVSCHTAESRNFLYERGYTDEMIEQKSIGYIPKETSTIYRGIIAKESGLAGTKNNAFLAGRISFPYFRQNIVTDIRGRIIKADADVKYKSPLGDTYFRGADYPYNFNATKHDLIVLTEGEIKSDISDAHGIPTIGLPGMNIWKSGFVQREGQQVIICFDSQRDNSDDVDRAIYHIARHIDNPRIATLPLMGRDKMDIDTLIMHHGIDIYKMIIHAAIDFPYWMKLKRITHDRSHLLR